MVNEEGKVPVSAEPTDNGGGGCMGQVCSDMLGLDSEILPGRSDPSAEISRTRSG